MSVRLECSIPDNVVEIGNEVAQGMVDALNAAENPTASNPLLTKSAGDAAYLEKDGGGTVIGTLIVDTNGTVGGDTTTITGTKVEVSNFGVGTVKIDPVLGVTFPDGTSQGTAAANLVTSVAGKTGAVTLAVADVSGAAATASSNNFTASQVIEVTDNTNAALRVTQLGTGEAFRVEDSANPDATPFSINAAGQVGIGTAAQGAWTLYIQNITGGVYLGNQGILARGACEIGYSSTGAVVPLTINNTGTASSLIVNSTASQTSDCVRITNLGSGNSFVVEDSTNPDASPFVINQNGNVGIGTTLPTSTLQVAGTLLASSAGTSVSPFFRFEATNTGSTQDVLRITNGTLGNSFVVYDQASDTTPFIVDASGNVGVKNASPTTDLDVTGNAQFTTADITSAPAAGDSSTKVPTTAWVQAEVPAASTSTAGKVQLATNAETANAVSTTKAVTPDDLMWVLAQGGNFTGLYVTSWNTGTSGTGASAGGGTGYGKSAFAPTTAAGYGAIWNRLDGTSGIGNGSNTGVDWSKRVIIGCRVTRGNAPSDSNAVMRFTFGKSSTFAAGDPTNRAIGWSITGGGAVTVLAHNGTGLSTATTSFTPTTGKHFDIVVVSDGAGTVTCYVNGSNVGSTTGGPTTWPSASALNTLVFEAQNTAIVTGSPTGGILNNAFVYIAP